MGGKIQNSRQLLLRAARDSSGSDEEALSVAASRMGGVLERLRDSRDLDQVRGAEGEAARGYFEVFGHMVRGDRATFTPAGRTRRPPRDEMNAVLSFLYTMVRLECTAALEGVGLDPQIGYLHALRPGRPALALDLMEELRPVVPDRLALTLVNRKQLRAEHFERTPGDAVLLNEEGRRLVIVSYQRRKEEELQHRLLERRVPIGLLPHLQARLLARHLRGDTKEYVPFLHR